MKNILWVKLITYKPQAAKCMLILFMKEIWRVNIIYTVFSSQIRATYSILNMNYIIA